MVSSKGNRGMGNVLHCHHLTISPHSTCLQTFRNVPSSLNPYNATSLLDTQSLHMIPAIYLILWSQPTNLSSNFYITFMPKPQSFNITDLILESFFLFYSGKFLFISSPALSLPLHFPHTTVIPVLTVPSNPDSLSETSPRWQNCFTSVKPPNIYYCSFCLFLFWQFPSIDSSRGLGCSLGDPGQQYPQIDD